ncbi:class II fructose-bisphosphate aldolase [Actinoplanes xinjiangensis]|uniref:Fructose-bisphosphate aldolase class II n=1 Tax=Actinoplanes xinjiangensis TaxID=512350 RepID=A0A316FHC3_9ACTN|nr:class II fructose-bisphosphate aldolase [Actinoplanes xinjiangensis]PWK47525.1 fructose-bisphosphate aldolase class II [Actinoplanes xinjiangensis]GIF39547.1 fructose-bisphosphate aldolase [Actinoplanes xinjiangensis]
MTSGHTLGALLRRARAGGYAVPAFNVVDEATMAAVLDTAAAMGSPVVVQTSARTAAFWGATALRAVFEARRASSGVAAVLHLDHCADAGQVLDCVRAGWESALFDASDRPFVEAVAATRRVVVEAARYGAEIEGEFERIAAIGEAPPSGATSSFERSREFVSATGVACLSPDLGTRHGCYDADPQIRLELARRLAASVPVVLHGGSGLSAPALAGAVAAGVSKINFSSAVKSEYLATVRDVAGSAGEPLDLPRALRARVGAVCGTYIRRSGSQGRQA